MMADLPTITINMDAKCDECGKGGRSGNGLCLSCTTKAIQGKPMRSPQGRMVAMRFKDLKKSR
jgi:hypothetical protein